mmetsp:Transcript_18870/g.26607  ORF Transcript_18870/g.26607 Transcript_18870/m.26607 type:complete len:645 (-) Transcript_18870:235-2169(-)
MNLTAHNPTNSRYYSKECQGRTKDDVQPKVSGSKNVPTSLMQLLVNLILVLALSSTPCGDAFQSASPLSALPTLAGSQSNKWTKKPLGSSKVIISRKKVYLHSSSSSSSTPSSITTSTTSNSKDTKIPPPKLTNINSKNDMNQNNNDNDNNEDVIAPLALLLFTQFILFIGVGAVIPTIPLYGKEIGLSASASGIVISAPAVALLLGSRMGGQYADVARKPAMVIGMAIIALSDAGTAFATGLPALIVARLGLGAGRCISEAGERGMLADLASKIPTFRGRALAAQQATVALGIAIGAPFGGIIVEQYGPRSSFLCVTAAAITAMFLYLLLPETIVGNGQQQNTSTTEKEEDNRKFLKQESLATAEIEAEMMGPSEAVVMNDDDAASSSLNENNENNKDDGDWSVLIQTSQWKGLAACQIGSSFGYAAKIASIPILATDILPGGAAGAGVLLSAAGLSGIVGASIGGILTDRFTAKFTAILAGIVSATGLFLIPFALALSPTDTTVGSGLEASSLTFSIPFVGSISGDMGIDAITFASLVIVWSLGAAAQAPALIAIAQQLAPPGREATALALPRAAGDGTYIVAPFLLGLVTDSALTAKGAECAVAGVCVLMGVVALGLFSGDAMNEPTATTAITTEQQPPQQ